MDFSTIVATPTAAIVLCFCAVLIGMSKTGIQGVTALSIPLMALFFGGKPSTGVILPILCMADLIAVTYYRRDAEWKYIFKLLPSAIIGFFVAIAVDRIIPGQFTRLMGVCVLAGIAVMFWTEHIGKEHVVSQKWWYAPLFGLFGGFTTMIGNAAGPIMAVYLLSMHLPKKSFVGTSAWFFMIINLLKVPLQIFVWNNITWTSFTLDLMMLPCIAIGAWIGIRMVNRLPEKGFRTMIVWLTILSSLALFI